MAKRLSKQEIRKRIVECNENIQALEIQHIALLNYRQGLLDALNEKQPETAPVEGQPEAAALENAAVPTDVPLHKVQLGDGIPLPILPTDEADIPELEDA